MKNLSAIFVICLLSFSCSGENKAEGKQNAKKQENDEIVLSYRDWMSFSEKLLNGVEVKLSDVHSTAGSPSMTYISPDWKCIMIYKYLSADESKIKECIIVLKDPQIEKIGYGLNREKLNLND